MIDFQISNFGTFDTSAQFTIYMCKRVKGAKLQLDKIFDLDFDLDSDLLFDFLLRISTSVSDFFDDSFRIFFRIFVSF